MKGKHSRKNQLNTQEICKSQEGMAEVVPIDSAKPDFFPDLKELKYIKARSAVYSLTRYYKSLLLEKALKDEEDQEKRFAIQVASDFDFDLWLAYKKMFGFSDKLAEEVEVPWGRIFKSSTSFKDLFESRWDGDKSVVKFMKRFYSRLETKQEVLDKYSQTNPVMDSFMEVVEKAVAAKRTGEVMQFLAENGEVENGEEMTVTMKKIKQFIKEVAVRTELLLVNPEEKSHNRGESVVSLMVSSKNNVLKIASDAKKLEEDIMYGKAAANEIMETLTSKSGIKSSESKLQLVEQAEESVEDEEK